MKVRNTRPLYSKTFNFTVYLCICVTEAGLCCKCIYIGGSAIVHTGTQKQQLWFESI